MSFELSLKKYSDYKPTNLVLQGGGVLGIAYCGAIDSLQNMGIMQKVVNFAGTSAGSIIAALLACGGTSGYIRSKLETLEPLNLLDYGYKLSIPYNLLTYMGICKGDKFEEWYGDIIEDLTGNRNITLAEANVKYSTTLIITAVDLVTQTTIYMSHTTFPDLPIVKAVRASISISGIFIPVKLGDHILVDGGTISDYPIECFSDHPPKKTLGLMLVTKSRKVKTEPSSIRSLLSSLINCLMMRERTECMRPEDWQNSVKIDCGDIQPFDFGIDDKQKMNLYDRGKAAVYSHFENIDNHATQYEYLNGRKWGT